MRRIAFLRGINVSGKNKIPMKELVGLCEELGWDVIDTILQTGNVVFSSEDDQGKTEDDLERAIEANFGFSIPVITRDAEHFVTSIDNSPFVEQVANYPSKVIHYFTKQPTTSDTLEYLLNRAKAEEEIAVMHNSIWIYFPKGVGSSKLTPTVIDRAAGSCATGRNWNTLQKIYSIVSDK